MAATLITPCGSCARMGRAGASSLSCKALRSSAARSPFHRTAVGLPCCLLPVPPDRPHSCYWSRRLARLSTAISGRPAASGTPPTSTGERTAPLPSDGRATALCGRCRLGEDPSSGSPSQGVLVRGAAWTRLRHSAPAAEPSRSPAVKSGEDTTNRLRCATASGAPRRGSPTEPRGSSSAVAGSSPHRSSRRTDVRSPSLTPMASEWSPSGRRPSRRLLRSRGLGSGTSLDWQPLPRRPDRG
jgi:hypothetical protein